MSLANASNDANVTGVTNVTNVDFFEAAVEMNALNVTSLVASTAAWLIAILHFSADILFTLLLFFFFFFLALPSPEEIFLNQTHR